jgi:hypothetical protein
MRGRANLRVLPGGREANIAAGRSAGRAAAGVAAGRSAGRAAAGVAAGRSAGRAAAGVAAGRSAGRAAAGVAAGRSRGLVASALAAAGSWLLEPAEPAAEPVRSAPAGSRPVIAVFGLARGCGVTVVSRALAAELASRDADGAAAVHCDSRAAGIPLATQPATHLARALADVPGADTRAVGRLCLVGGAERSALADTARYFAPLVLDSGSTSLGGVPAALADRVIVVASPSTEPALVSVAANCLARLGHEPISVLNRAPPDEASEQQAATAPARPAAPASGPEPPHRMPRTMLHLPESRMGAQLALGGREPRGELGRAIAALADLCGVAG